MTTLQSAGSYKLLAEFFFDTNTQAGIFHGRTVAHGYTLCIHELWATLAGLSGLAYSCATSLGPMFEGKYFAELLPP